MIPLSVILGSRRGDRLPRVLTAMADSPSAPSSEDPVIDSLRLKIEAANKLVQQACAQVVLMNNRISALHRRYSRAQRVRNKPFRYTFRLQICSMEGVRNLFYEYACRKCEELEELKVTLMQARLAHNAAEGSWRDGDDSSLDGDNPDSSFDEDSADSSLEEINPEDI